MNYAELSPEAYQGFIQTKKALGRSTLGKPLIELVNLRVSQINGCAYCLCLHAKSLRDEGYPEEKLDSLAGWRVSALYSDRERAALNWAESMTLVAETHAPDSQFSTLKKHFNDSEVSDLCFVVSLMNALNRMAIAMRK